MLMLLAVFGVSLVVADGVLTPAQSVLGAIQGIRVADESITTATIIGVSCTILVLLFAVQPLGVHRVSSAFAPIVILWLLFNAVFGIYNLIQHDHTVLKAFSPYFAGSWLMRNKTEGWKSLGGVLLCFTGVECLFADMGAFSRRAVQLSWLCLAYPCLMLAYIGQAAHLVDDPSGYSNPFFNTVPPGMFWPSLVLAILAAVVASQATITACFQLIAQIMNSSYFPQIQMHYTSDKYHGQVYIPIANWLLMIGCVVVTAVFNNVSLLTLLFFPHDHRMHHIPKQHSLTPTTPIDHLSRSRVRGVRHPRHLHHHQPGRPGRRHRLASAPGPGLPRLASLCPVRRRVPHILPPQSPRRSLVHSHARHQPRSIFPPLALW